MITTMTNELKLVKNFNLDERELRKLTEKKEIERSPWKAFPII